MQMPTNIPSAKVTAVGVAGAVYTFAMLALTEFSTLDPSPALVAAGMTALVALVGYVVPPHERDTPVARRPPK